MVQQNKRMNRNKRGSWRGGRWAVRWLSADRDRKWRKKLCTYTCQWGSSVKTLHKLEKPT